MTNRRRVYMVRRAVTSAVLLGIVGGGSVLVVAWADRTPKSVETAGPTVSTVVDELVGEPVTPTSRIVATSTSTTVSTSAEGAKSATQAAPATTQATSATTLPALITAPPPSAPAQVAAAQVSPSVAGTVVTSAISAKATPAPTATTRKPTATTRKPTATTKRATTPTPATSKPAATKAPTTVTTRAATAATEATVSLSGVAFPPLGAIPADVTSLGTFKVVCYSLGTGTASGERVGLNVVAVDPAVIALRTRLYIDGVGWRTALDTGSAVKGKIVDIWMPTTADCLKWGAKNREVFKANTNSAGASTTSGSGSTASTTAATTPTSATNQSSATTAPSTTSPSTLSGGDAGP
jgi:3D (Asp-Asp-Asp) domain-containing protein